MIVASEQVSTTACAKINLNLHVIGQNENGMHQLQSVVVFARIGDELVLQRRPDGQTTDQLIITGPFASLLEAGESNLVLKASNAFKARYPDVADVPYSISLTKNLPVAAGIGGGSADAAALLRLMEKQLPSGVDDIDLKLIAQKLGADVPVCLNNKPQLMSGTGEVIAVLPKLPQLFAVLVNPLKSLSTAQVFANLTNKSNKALPEIPAMFDDFEHFIVWLKSTRNDLMESANLLLPVIGDIVHELERFPNCRFVQMSGSGATVFGLFETLDDATNSARALTVKWPSYWIEPTEIVT